MEYLSGIIAFGIPCRDNSCGIWNYTKEQFTDENLLKPYNSEQYPFGDYGIEENKIIPYHEDEELFNVATHIRAYLDMLVENRFEELKGMFEQAINDGKCRGKIFSLVYDKLRARDDFMPIHMFMAEEFGNAWLSYCQDETGREMRMQEKAAKMAAWVTKGQK